MKGIKMTLSMIAITLLAMLATAMMSRALSANAPTVLAVGEFDDLPVLASATIYEGSLIGSSGGYARALTAGDRFLGHSMEKVIDTSGVSGTKTVRARTGRYRLQCTLASVAITDIGKPVYASDDATLTLTAGSNSRVGFVWKYVAANTAIIEFTPAEIGESAIAYSATAASAEVENTTDETAFDKSKTLDGSQFAAGDVIRIRAQGVVVDNNSTDTLTVKLYLGTEEIVSTGAVDVADGDIFYIDCDIVVRTTGATGTIVAAGVVGLGVIGTVTAKPFLKAQATEDISGNVAVALKATWSVAHADNEVRLDILNVQVLKA